MECPSEFVVDYIIAQGDHMPYILALRPKMKKTTAKINPTTNRIQAMFAAVPAIPVNPKTPATNAIMRNAMAHPNMICLLLYAYNGVMKMTIFTRQNASIVSANPKRGAAVDRRTIPETRIYVLQIVDVSVGLLFSLFALPSIFSL